MRISSLIEDAFQRYRQLVALSKIVFLQKFLASMNVRLVEGRISILFRSIENVAASEIAAWLKALN